MQAVETQETKTERYFTLAERNMLKTMSKMTEKHSPRNYGTKICWDHGKVFVTNGYALCYIESDNQAFTGKGTLCPEFFTETSVHAPSISGVIPKEPMEVLNADGLMEFCVAQKPIKSKTTHLHLKARRAPHMSLAFDPDTHNFNATLLGKYLKAMPKGTELFSAKVSKDGVLVLDLSGGFKVIACAIKEV